MRCRVFCQKKIWEAEDSKVSIWSPFTLIAGFEGAVKAKSTHPPLHLFLSTSAEEIRDTEQHSCNPQPSGSDVMNPECVWDARGRFRWECEKALIQHMGICWDAGTIMHWGRFLRETPFYIDKHRHAHSNTLAMLSHLTLLTSVPEKKKKKK